MLIVLHYEHRVKKYDKTKYFVLIFLGIQLPNSYAGVGARVFD